LTAPSPSPSPPSLPYLALGRFSLSIVQIEWEWRIEGSKVWKSKIYSRFEGLKPLPLSSQGISLGTFLDLLPRVVLVVSS
jgi:hypothetical protein